MGNQFTISVIMPVYNVENYLREAIESVITQRIDFERYIELILVNDGSTDNSAQICREYQQKYSQNIRLIEQENSGVSAARNAALDAAQGKYVTFLDGDDKWDSHALKKMYAFFEKHFEEIDVVAAKIMFFEAIDKPHSLNQKFEEGSRIADLRAEKDSPPMQSTAATTMIKREAIGSLRFDTRLKYGEDATFVNKIILKKCAYGLAHDAVYFYRRRANGTSAVDSQRGDKCFYLDTLLYYHMELLAESKKLYGEVVPFIQAIIGHDICWRFANPYMKSVLNEDEQAQYAQYVHSILQEIDDRYLLTSSVQKQMEKKNDVMQYKYGVEIYPEMRLNTEDGKLYFRDIPLFNLANNKTKCFQIERAYIQEDMLIIEALVAKWLLRVSADGATLDFRINDKSVPVAMEEYPVTKVRTSNGIRNYYQYCRMEYSLQHLQPGESLTFMPYLKTAKGTGSISINYGKFALNNRLFDAAYCFFGPYAMKNFRTKIRVYYPKNRKQTETKWKLKMLLELVQKRRFDVAHLRLVSLPRFQKKQADAGRIWLVSDRVDNAGDNGEVFFRYLCAHTPPGVRPVFMIGKNADEAVKKRLKATGEVIYAEDKRYPLFFLSAEKVISSGAGEFTINPFWENRKYYQDLMTADFYYLQHGVACADLSAWLNRFNKNIHRFFTSGERERQSVITGNYGYRAEQVLLTGQARFDALYENTKKQLLVLPTWRRSIRAAYDEKTSSVYFDAFKDTAYFQFYNGLINHERLLAAMRQYGYTGLFCLHPIFMKQYIDFEQNDVFRVNEGYIDYNQVFAESAVMVTDYSSVLFDFAYLRKPVVYAQFDKEQFFADQIYDEGYFSYENDGFGPVCYDLESTVDALIQLMEQNCDEPALYKERVDAFFAFNDKENAKRILEAIIHEKHNKE